MSESKEREVKILEENKVHYGNEYQYDENEGYEIPKIWMDIQNPNSFRGDPYSYYFEKVSGEISGPTKILNTRENTTKPESRKHVYPDPYSEYNKELLESIELRLQNYGPEERRKEAQKILFNKPSIAEFYAANRSFINEQRNMEEKYTPLIPDNNWQNPNAIAFLKENNINYVNDALEFETPF